MRFYEASSTIRATPDSIWDILTDGPSYSSWDNGVVRVEGRILPGETIKVVSEAPLRPAAEGSTEFTVREEYPGPLLGMIWRTILDLGQSFAKFAEGLKRHAELRQGANS